MQDNVNTITEVGYANIVQVAYDWTDTEGQLTRWKLIVDLGPNGLEYVYTYNPRLTQLGTHAVEFYRDTSMRLCIRTPKKKGEQ